VDDGAVSIIFEEEVMSQEKTSKEGELISVLLDNAAKADSSPPVHPGSCGRIPGQGAFTREGYDLSTGEPLYEMAGLGKIFR